MSAEKVLQDEEYKVKLAFFMKLKLAGCASKHIAPKSREEIKKKLKARLSKKSDRST